MKKYISKLLFLILFNVVNVQCSDIVTDCEEHSKYLSISVKLICNKSRNSNNNNNNYRYSIFHKSCYRKMIDGDFNQNTDELLTGDCRGDRLDGRLPNAFGHINFYNISYHGIKHLTNADLNFPYLERFNASHNQLTNISANLFMNTEQMVHIDLSFNEITEIDSGVFKKSTELSNVDLSFNKILSLNKEVFSTLENLQYLNLSNNLIETIDKSMFEHNGNMQRLHLENNKIVSLNEEVFTALGNLKYLNLSNNLIETIDKTMFQNNRNLLVLNLENNPIKRFDLRISNTLLDKHSLITVKVTCENFEEIDVSGMENMALFEFEPRDDILMIHENRNRNGYYDNSVSEIECTKKSLKHLKYFNIPNNQLENIPQVIEFLQPSIEVLDLSSNRLWSLNAQIFEKFSNLTHLNLTNTGISTIHFVSSQHLSFPDYNNKLQVLHLEENPITMIDCNFFLLLLSISAVKLSWENFKGLDTSCTGDSLEININNTDEIIIRLKRNNSEFHQWSTGSFKQLTYLNISGNHLGNIPELVDALGSSIETLDLSSNFIGKITTKTFQNLIDLKYLNLSDTHLSKFGFNTLYNQNRLKSLDLSDNNLKSVDFTAFLRNFKELEILNLEGNDLVEIDSITHPIFPKLSLLGISKNRFSCQYLGKFLLQWEGLPLLHNPSINQTHIDGVDCLHEDQQSITNSPKTRTTTSMGESAVTKYYQHQHSTENPKTVIITSTDRTNNTPIGPATRYDCRSFSSKTAPVTCDHIKEIDSSCMGSSIAIDFDSMNEIIFRSSSNHTMLQCTVEDFHRVTVLNISGNHLQNTAQVIEMLGSSIEILDLSSNFIGILNVSTFERFDNNLKYLNLSRTNLSNFGFNTFYHQNKLKVLDLSYNHLAKVDFTLLLRNFQYLTTLNLEGNILVEIDSITRSIFPKLSSLGISKNYFSCRYVAKFLLQWENLQLPHNPSNQTHIGGVDCHNEINEGKSTMIETKETHSIDKNNKAIESLVETANHFSTDLQVMKYLFFVLCGILCIYFVSKSKFIHKIQRKFNFDNLESVVAYQTREPDGQQELIGNGSDKK